MRDEQYVPIEMKLKPEAIEKIEILQKLLKSENGATAIRQAIEIATLVVKAVVKNEHVILERTDGSRAKLVIPTLEKLRNQND